MATYAHAINLNAMLNLLEPCVVIYRWGGDPWDPFLKFMGKPYGAHVQLLIQKQ